MFRMTVRRWYGEGCLTGSESRLIDSESRSMGSHIVRLDPSVVRLTLTSFECVQKSSPWLFKSCRGSSMPLSDSCVFLPEIVADMLNTQQDTGQFLVAK